MRTYWIVLFISVALFGGACSDDDSCPASVQGTFDIPTKAMADGVCQATGASCKVCVQEVDANGNAVRWSALTNLPGDCSCPAARSAQNDASAD